MWSFKKDRQRQDGDAQAPRNERPSSSYEPDERSRLLPANPRSANTDGYLDPDDPAVRRRKADVSVPPEANQDRSRPTTYGLSASYDT